MSPLWKGPGQFLTLSVLPGCTCGEQLWAAAPSFHSGEAGMPLQTGTPTWHIPAIQNISVQLGFPPHSSITSGCLPCGSGCCRSCGGAEQSEVLLLCLVSWKGWSWCARAGPGVPAAFPLSQQHLLLQVGFNTSPQPVPCQGTACHAACTLPVFWGAAAAPHSPVVPQSRGSVALGHCHPCPAAGLCGCIPGMGGRQGLL